VNVSLEVAGAALIGVAFAVGLVLGLVVGFHDGRLVGAAEERGRK
jgi:hypothetical protein